MLYGQNAGFRAGVALVAHVNRRGRVLSYLDDGDAIDLRRGIPRPAADKRRVRASRTAYRRPAPVRRHAFSGYAIHDLVLRLVEGDPAHYRHDSALAYDEASERQVCVEIERPRRRSRSLRAIRDGDIRYSAIGFDLRLRSCPGGEARGGKLQSQTTGGESPRLHKRSAEGRGMPWEERMGALTSSPTQRGKKKQKAAQSAFNKNHRALRGAPARGGRAARQ